MRDLTKYELMRPDMATGDLLQWRGTSALAWAIRLITRQQVNHSGWVIRFEQYDQDRVYTLESLSRGIDINLLSTSLRGYRGQCYWHKLKAGLHHHRQNIGREALKYASKKYDYKSLVSNLWGYVPIDIERLFCSEYVAQTLVDAKLIKTPEKAPRPGQDMIDLGCHLEEGVKLL